MCVYNTAKFMSFQACLNGYRAYFITCAIFYQLIKRTRVGQVLSQLVPQREGTVKMHRTGL